MDKYYICIKNNNEFQIRVFHEYEDQTPQESMKKVNEWLEKENRKNITINEFNTYEEATRILNELVPYKSDININYEYRKYFEKCMNEENKKELERLINDYIMQTAHKEFNSFSPEGFKGKFNHWLKEHNNE